MSEEPHSQDHFDEQFNQIAHNEQAIAEIDAAHEVAIARDHHETNAALALASMRLVEQAMTDHPGNIGGRLRQELQTAVDGQATGETRTYEQTRNIGVASKAHDVYSQQKQIEDYRGGNVRSWNYQPEDVRARNAADFTVHKLKSTATNSMHEADNAEHRMRHAS